MKNPTKLDLALKIMEALGNVADDDVAAWAEKYIRNNKKETQ